MNLFYTNFCKYVAVFTFLFPTLLSAQYFVDFEVATSSSTFTTNYGAQQGDLNGLEWELGPEVLIGDLANDLINGDRAARLRGRDGAIMQMLEDKQNGIGTISFLYKQYGSDTDQQPWAVEYSTNGGVTWTQVGSTFIGTSTVQTFSAVVNSADNGRIRIVLTTTPGATSGNRRLNIDDITITDFSGTPQNDTLVSFNSTSATIFDDAGNYNIAVTVNPAFTGANKTVDVVLTSGNAAVVNGFSSQTLTFTAGGALSQNVALTVVTGIISGPETFTFQLQNPSTGLLLGTNTQFELTISEPVVLPLYTISTVRGVNTDGAPDSVGVLCQVEGTVLGVNFGTDQQLSFFINDGTAGMGVFIPATANTFGYTVQEGDSIRISGRVAVFRGLAQMDNVTAITVLGTGTVPTPTVVTSLGEATEGELVTLENVTILSQSDWGTTFAGGYDVDVVTTSNDTLLIRIDGDTELFGTALPGCVLDITGIGTQFSTMTTAPFTNGYRLQPRFNSDITVLEACVAPTIPTYSIATIRGNNTNGIPDSLNVTCRVRGTVYGINLRVDGGMEFTIHDNTAGIGVYVPASANTFGYTVAEGDSVEIVGDVRHFNGLGQMGFLESITVLGQGTLREPRVVTVLDESTESDLVKLVNVTKAASSNWPSATANANITLNSPSGTFTARILSVTNIVNDIPAPIGAFNLIGIGSQFDNSNPYTDGYQLIPRRAQDFEAYDPGTAINSLELGEFVAYPNPADQTVTLSFENSKNEAMLIDIFDATGKHTKAIATSLVASKNNVELNLNGLVAGYYFIRLQTTDGVYNTKILKN